MVSQLIPPIAIDVGCLVPELARRIIDSTSPSSTSSVVNSHDYTSPRSRPSPKARLDGRRRRVVLQHARARNARAMASSSANASPIALALKEWHPAIEAMRVGEQHVVLRKGGVRDDVRAQGGFDVKTRRFALFPTNFHVDDALLRDELNGARARGRAGDMRRGERVRVGVVGELTGVWTIDGARGGEALKALAAYHCWSEKLAETRMKYEPTAAVTVLEIRAYETRDELVLEPDLERYGGCKSWVDIDAWTPNARACVSDEDFARRGASLRADLAKLGARDILNA